MNKEKIAILVDSACDVPQYLQEELPIYCAPVTIQYPNECYFDRVNITPDEVYNRLEKEIPTTSLPTGENVEKVLTQIQKDGYEKVIAFTISSALSGTYRFIELMLEDSPLEGKVIDTKSIGIGSGLFAIEAAQLAESGRSFAEIVRTCSETKKSKVFISLSTLEYLQKGGRIGLVSAKVGQLLKVKPIVSCNHEGVYYTAAKVRGKRKRIPELLKLVDEVLDEHGQHPFVLAVAHGKDDQAEVLYEEMKERYSHAQHIYYGDISPALGVHTGPGLLGVGIYFLG